MGLKVTTTCLQWSQQVIPQSPSSSQTLASAISSPSRRRSRDGGVLVCRFVHRADRSSLFGTKLSRSRSCEFSRTQIQTIRRACSASLDNFSDEEFSKKIQELALRFQLSDEDENSSMRESMRASDEDNSSEEVRNGNRLSDEVISNSVEPPWVEDIIPATIERKANSVDLPFSLRIIKRKLKWQEGFREAGESAYCSVKKAFASMVFIIRELHSFTLQMREMLYYEDLQGILERVQKEMHASFVWLFQQVFSHTPTLMVYVMILLANFTVHSMASNAAIAGPSPAYPPTTETVSIVENHEKQNPKFDSSAIKTFSVSNSSGKTISIGGNNGGGGKGCPTASGTDGEGRYNGQGQYRTIFPDGASQLSSYGTTGEAESMTQEDEFSLWNRIVEEASEMQAAVRDESLDQETVQRMVSPVTAKMEEDDYADYLRTELLYQMSLTQDPSNVLLLANYAQFLYLVARDYDRAEEYFKKAIKVEPPDAEAYSKYANFLWQAKKDLWAAEETFLEAISAEPGNSHYAANYAHFLWNTGGEDTCFPLDTEQQA